MNENLAKFIACLEYERDRNVVGVKFLLSETEYQCCPFEEATHAYLYGYPKHLKLAGMSGFCKELMAQPYQTKDLNLSLLCSNARFSGSWRDDEMGVSMPYDMFCEVSRAVVQTMNVFEPDYKKREIAERADGNPELEGQIDIQYGSNYYESCLGVAKKGVTGYYKKRD